MTYSIPCLDPSTFLKILQALAQPEKYTVTVPASILTLRFVGQKMKEEDGFSYIETTVDAPDDWDQVIVQVSCLNPVTFAQTEK